uniref:AIG1-type G domain-containing protein n=1 Tax=Poecilia latipinna TaxID=48699 RepID=A0A3B3UV66_9TELE
NQSPHRLTLKPGSTGELKGRELNTGSKDKDNLDKEAGHNHLRIVMIGGSLAGKSSRGNIILGKNVFNVNKNYDRRTTCSEISHSVIEGRRLTVVDSPGWFDINTLQETSEMDKLEIENSVNLCPPGPHAVLLFIPVIMNIDESYLRSVQEHMSLFREEIWKHTLVLFTYGDWLGVKTVEERIESDEGLQWIVNKCENRYHVLNNKDHSDKTQVKELLEKIEEMWAGNEDPYYEVEKLNLEDCGGYNVYISHQNVCFYYEGEKLRCEDTNGSQSQPATELRIVLIGGRRSDGSLRGKSSVGNFILGQNVFDTSRRTAQSEARQQEVFGRRVTVVDTPGWWWYWPTEDTPKLDQIEIQNSVHLCPPGPHVFLLVIPVDLHSSQLVKASLKQHLELFNADVFSHTIVLFTAVTPSTYEEKMSRIRRNPVLQWILQQCGDRKHFLNLSNREDRDQVKKLLDKIETLITINGGRHCSVDRNHLRIVMIGGSFAGKSSTGNTILVKNMFNVNEKGDRTTHSEIGHSVVEGRRLTVVDSPGWFCFNTLQETNEMDKLEIENSVNLCPPGPHAVLLVVPLAINTDESYLRVVQEHMSLFREEIWKHTLVIFTYGDWLGVKTVEERIESDEGLQWIVNKCENRYHVLNNKDHSDKTQVKELLEKIEEMWLSISRVRKASNSWVLPQIRM